MKQPSVTCRARIDAKIFRHFAMFDAFRLRRRWQGPALFALILTVSSLVCFFSGRDQAWLLGTVLLVVGLGMPAVYVGTFMMQLRAQVKRLQLSKPQLFYTVTMGERLTVHNERKNENDLVLPWDKVFGVWRGRDAFYLYVSAQQAFLLPDGQYELEPMALWQWLGERLPAEKLHGKTIG